jgi:hypothetical protein
MKMRVLATTLFSAGNAGGTITSSAVSVEHLLNGCIQAVFSGGGSPVGSLAVEAGNDGTTFLALGGSATVAISADGTNLIHLSNMGYKWIRLKYTRTSGTGTLVASLHAKG